MKTQKIIYKHNIVPLDTTPTHPHMRAYTHAPTLLVVVVDGGGGGGVCVCVCVYWGLFVLKWRKGAGKRDLQSK